MIFYTYVRALTICLLLVYFVSAAGCHCFDLTENSKRTGNRSIRTAIIWKIILNQNANKELTQKKLANLDVLDQ